MDHAAFVELMNSLPGKSQYEMNNILDEANRQNQNTPGARGGNLICLPAQGNKQGGGDDESR